MFSFTKKVILKLMSFPTKLLKAANIKHYFK